MSTRVYIPFLIRLQRITGGIIHPECDSSHSPRCLLPPALVGSVGRHKASERVSEREGFSFMRYRELLRGKHACDRLTLVGCQVPTKPLYHSPSSTEQGRENTMKDSWVEIRTGRSLSTYSHGQNRLDWGKLINQSNQSRIMRNKNKP